VLKPDVYISPPDSYQFRVIPVHVCVPAAVSMRRKANPISVPWWPYHNNKWSEPYRSLGVLLLTRRGCGATITCNNAKFRVTVCSLDLGSLAICNCDHHKKVRSGGSSAFHSSSLPPIQQCLERSRTSSTLPVTKVPLRYTLGSLSTESGSILSRKPRSSA
jgi:hypothetical protein